MFGRYSTVTRRCDCRNKSDETDVNSRLAITPAQMMQMTNAGRAVSMASMDSFAYFDNAPSVDDMPLEYTRGIDENQLWDASIASKRKFKKFQQEQKTAAEKGGM